MPKTTTKRAKKQKAREPLWKGPEQDGITQSLLGRFLCCRERFRLLVVEGLSPADDFNRRMEYGNMWHVCEELFTAAGNPRVRDSSRVQVTSNAPWLKALKDYCQGLCKKYPTQQPQIDKYYNICKVQFPIYIDYWKKHPDVKSRTPLLQEETFCVPYKLPSGRTVKLRGKWDSVDLIGKRPAGVWLQENKTKGEINGEQLARQLTFDLQIMFYLTALEEYQRLYSGKDLKNVPIKGVRYNVIRRPLSGGKGSITKLKNVNRGKRGPLRQKLPERPETDAEFYDRLGGIIREDPDHYFMRWQVVVTPEDVKRFKREFLNPVLEHLCDWWNWASTCKDSGFGHSNGLHWRHPFGVYNPMNEGRASELDEYLSSGSTLGLQRTDGLFKELD